MRLSDGSWLLLYNVDNLWPVHDPAPMPAYGRCALGWAILAADTLEVLARAKFRMLCSAATSAARCCSRLRRVSLRCSRDTRSAFEKVVLGIIWSAK